MKFYTKNQMFEYLKKHFPLISLEPEVINGFNCIHHFCELEKGWFPNHSKIDEYELSMVLRYDGSKKDKLKWNCYSNNKFKTDKKDLTIESKKRRVSKRNTTREHKFKYGRKSFELFLSNLKEAGVTTLRRNKKNQYKGLFYFRIDRDSKLFKLASGNISKKDIGIIYLPDERGYPFISMDAIKTEKELVELINEKSLRKIKSEDILNKKIKFYIPK